MRKFLLFASLAGLFTMSSCLKGSNNNGSTTCNYDACTLKAPDAEVDSVAAYIARNNITATKHCSGMYYTIVTAGTGDAAPTPCSAIAINYVGTLPNGNVFDKSTAPVVFNLYQLITGWRNGLPLLKKGGKIKMYVPPTLGYGPAGSGPVPPNTMMIFDVDLLDFQ